MENNVLIVDDYDDFRNLMKTALASMPFEIIECSNGLEGLALIKSGLRPRLVVSDVQMPLMDGMSFLKELMKDPLLRAIPFILTSGCEEFEHEAMASGAVGFLSKLTLSEKLPSAVERLLYPN